MDLSALKALSLVITLAHNDPSLVGHLSEWKGYAWARMPLSNCPPEGSCSTPRQRWDWHRKEWVDFSFEPFVDGQTTVALTLIDNDKTDDDFVCVTAFFLDVDANPILMLHQNLHISPGQTITRRFALAAPSGSPAPSNVAVGSKQCRLGPHEDDDVYLRALKALREVVPRPL